MARSREKKLRSYVSHDTQFIIRKKDRPNTVPWSRHPKAARNLCLLKNDIFTYSFAATLVRPVTRFPNAFIHLLTLYDLPRDHKNWALEMEIDGPFSVKKCILYIGTCVQVRELPKFTLGWFFKKKLKKQKNQGAIKANKTVFF